MDILFLFKYIEILKRETQLWRARSGFESATRLAEAVEDYHVANFCLRDDPLTEEFGLKDLSWAMDKSGSLTIHDWEFFRDEWLEEWTKAYKEMMNSKIEIEERMKREARDASI